MGIVTNENNSLSLLQYNFSPQIQQVVDRKYIQYGEDPFIDKVSFGIVPVSQQIDLLLID